MSLLRNIGVGITHKIEKWLDENTDVWSGNYIINDDYTIDIRGDIRIKSEIGNLPDYIRFNHVNGNFTWQYSNTTDLIGMPIVVTGYLNLAWWNNLTSLKGFPRQIGGSVNMVCSPEKKGFTKADIRHYATVNGGIFI